MFQNTLCFFKIEALLEENKMELKRVLAENDKGDPFLEELRGTFVTTGLIQGFWSLISIHNM